MSTTQPPSKQNTITMILAGILVVLFIISTIAVVFTYFPTRHLLNPEFYKQILEDVEVYQNLPIVVSQKLASSISDGGDGSDLVGDSGLNLMILSQDEWESIITGLIDPVWLQTQTESTIDQFFEILLESPDPVNTPIEISIEEIKSRVAGPQGALAFKQILEAQSPCSANQLIGLLQLGFGLPASIETLLCRPPDYIISELVPAVEWFLSSVVEGVPDTLAITIPETLFGSANSDSADTPDLKKIPASIQSLRRFRTNIAWSPVIPLVILLMISLLTVRSLNDFLLWWGAPLLSAGLISLIVSLSLFPITNWAFGRLTIIETGLNFLLSTIIEPLGVVALSREFASRLTMSIIIPAAVMSIVGFLLLLVFYLRTRRSKSVDQQQIDVVKSAPDDYWE